ncbi:MAG: phosphatidate cytidylyltransferase [Planctomycetes bacterium]|nr:phosphatidate cytidylyltransferase [Planctomycetota bacterium]
MTPPPAAGTVLRQRLIVGTLLIAAVGGIVIVDLRTGRRTGTTVAVSLLTAASLFEMEGLLLRLGWRGMRVLLPLCGVFLVADVPLYLPGRPVYTIPLIVALGSLLRPESDRLRNALMAAGTLLYIAVPMQCLVRLAEGPGIQGFAPLLLAIAICKMGDTAAYFTGTTIGRHPLAPTISPKKTVEGAVGGLAGSIAVSVAAHAMLLPGILTLPRQILFGALVGAAGQVGDLVESWIKRRAGVKDSGGTLLAMGGILDLVDSLLFAAPAAYLLGRAWA